MDLRKLIDLKAMVQTDEDFGGIWKYFFDNFGEKPEFAATGKPANETMQMYLEPILEDICNRIVEREVMITQMILSEVPSHSFFHGPCLTDAGIAVVIYFDDVKMGMISLTPGLGSGMVHYARFTAVPVINKGAIMIQSKNTTSH
jgi:hypothetical protein